MTKQEQKIIERIRAIENGTFDEDSIKLLLIEIREYIQDGTILREICDFIAHPERNKGICHKSIDVKNIKLISINSLPSIRIGPTRKEDASFTLNPRKIEKKVFDLLVLGGIDDTGDELLIKHCNINKKQATKFIKGCYNLEGDYYFYKNDRNLQRWRDLNNLLKFVTGTINGAQAITQTEIINHFYNGILRLEDKLKYRLDVKKYKKHENDLLVVILALLHDSSFKLYDGTTARAYLSIHPKRGWMTPTLCLMHTGRVNFTLITTNVEAKNYIDLTEEDIIKYGLHEIPWNMCTRDQSGKLKLISAN